MLGKYQRHGYTERVLKRNPLCRDDKGALISRYDDTTYQSARSLPLSFFVHLAKNRAGMLENPQEGIRANS